ncbi:MAG TPA: MFS transporter [Rhizomicrobium sp.]|nr:MFS transporter [Rhizomicrobium sp.]
MTADSDPARVLKYLRPPVPIDIRTERIFLLVGAAALFAGYDVNIYGLATPQIQASLHIPENQVAPTLAYFRIAAVFAFLLAASADLVGRRRLLLFTIFGQAIFTLLSAFGAHYWQFVGAQFFTRIFGYAEEMLLFVVVAEEITAKARGWANTTIIAIYFLGAGLATAVFAAVDFLPHGWRALYVIGSVPIFLVAFLRQRLPETKRFQSRGEAGFKLGGALDLLKDIARQYPMRVLTVIIAASAFGFAISPATFLAQKYLQDVYHYSPGQVSLVLIPGGLIGLGLTIAAGRLSDRLGRKPMAIATAALAGIAFFFFYNHAPAWAAPPLWVLGFLGFFAGDTMIAGFALEIVPTHYRATVGGLRYAIEIGAGAAALALEGVLYDRLGGHGPALQWLLISIPITMIAILFLPEPAGKSLEEMSGA